VPQKLQISEAEAFHGGDDAVPDGADDAARQYGASNNAPNV
jgi:hypothetical protein